MEDFYTNVPESQIVNYTNPAVLEPTSECFMRQERPGSVNKSSLLSVIGSSNSSVGGRSTKTIVTGGHPFVCFATDDDYNKITSEYKIWVTTGLRIKRKGCVYAKKDNVLQPPFEFGVMHVHKEWFHQLAYNGQPLNDTHVDILFYYLRKKENMIQMLQ
ncbi:PREDICTED: uncharacterized protein LOC109228238 [Nicotiana attenuata]|uniref:uncharacterized protein LOC109228238 n=1 Tax=Nicotiana attenuata TaxID=49451 RepID=UPI000904653E|nr:PREDICTED: uncharacterized protein LOC109228238 [Nicotiana attenuata]